MSSAYTEVELKLRANGEANVYRVPVKRWRKWSPLARRVFNSHFYELRENQHVLTHPNTPNVSARMWRTIAWNAAWLAADSVMSASRAIEKEGVR